MKGCFYAVVFSVITAGLAAAQTTGVGIAAKVGTLGYGGDLTIGLGQYLSFRGGYNTLALKRDVDLDEATVKGKLAWQTIPLLLDWHPWGQGFRVSAGGVINDNAIKLSADMKQTLELENTEYSVESLDGSITFNRGSLYLGIGYGNAAGTDGRWHFACDFGVMYHGEPEVNAHATARDPAQQANLDRDLQMETDNLQHDMKGFQYYPVIAVGVSYAF